MLSICTKTNCLRSLLGGVCMLLLLNILLSYLGYKSETATSTFSRLSRKVHKYDRSRNHSSSNMLPFAPLAHAKDSPRNSTVIPVNASMLTAGNSRLQPEIDTVQTKLKNSTIPDLIIHNGMLQPTTAANLPECQVPSYDEVDFVENFAGGPITPNITLESLDVVESKLGPLLKPGGAFQPKDCIPKHHVAIVVPFRDRYAHLSVFLRNIHPFLMKQRIAYRVFIVEQTNGRPFNRAALMNIGFLEALKIFPWDCFVFHDVDLLPLDERNLYNCPRQPRHMSVAIDTLNYKLPYKNIFGGVSAMTRAHFVTVNGFSNSYFGWGGEDDDMFNRLKHANLFISRYPANIARYTMLKHQKEKANPKRYENLVNGISKMEMDGINSIKYEIYANKEFPTFTWYLAELKISDQNPKV